MQSLALKYRPRTFEGVVGQKAVSQLLKKMVEKGVTPPVLLFVGPRGCGKTSTARVLGAALNCEEDDKPCGKCVSCETTFDGSSFSYREIDASTNGRVEDIRTLQQDLLYAGQGNYQVVVLDEAHGLSTSASNALLKTLEEAPHGVIFILVSTEPDKIMKTVRSRCMTFQFRLVAPDVIARRLNEVRQEENLKIDDQVLIHLADRSDGALRDALMTLDQLTRAGISTTQEYEDMFGNPDYAPYLIEAMADGDVTKAYEILDNHIASTGNPASVLAHMVLAVKEIMIIQGGGNTTLKATPLKIRTALAQRLPAPVLFGIMRTMWDLKTKLRIGEDSSASLSLMVSVITSALKEYNV